MPFLPSYGYRVAQRATAERHEACNVSGNPVKGDRITVVGGRKVPLGTSGVCIWVGDGNFGMRCGLKTADGTVHWTALKNVRKMVEATA